VPLFGENFEPWVIMILPPGGFLTLALMLALFAHVKERRERASQAAASGAALRRAA
jgi:electron transport complex protein RnfE